jgi:hypothetical protein
MKSSEVAAAIAARTGAPVVANAAKVSSGVDYHKTRIIQTQGNAEAESRAYGRDEVLEGFFRRKQLHNLLDRMMCDAGMSESESRPLRDALDRHLDEEAEPSSSDSDEPEESASASTRRLLLQLAAIADKEPRSVGKDSVQKKKICCFDCGTLAAKQINEQVRASARLI